MRFYKYTLAPGETRKITARGRFIRGISGKTRYRVRLDGKVETDFETGIAFEAPDVFDHVEIINIQPDAMAVEISISDGYVSDNRMVGSFDVDGSIGVLTTAARSHETKAVQSISGSTVVLAENVMRRTATVQIDGPCYVDNTANGIEIPAGIFEWEVQSHLVLVPVSGTVSVRIMETLNG